MVGQVVLEGFHAVKHAVRFGATVGTVVVLDRVNPINGYQIEGPTLEKGVTNFTGYFSSMRS